MILTTPPNNIVNKKCHRVQNGHAQVIARNEREKNRQYLLIERHRVTKLLLRKFDTYYICFVDIDLLCPDTSLSCSFFSLALHTSPLNFLHIRFFFWFIYSMFSRILSARWCMLEWFAYALIHTHMAEMRCLADKIYDYLEKVHFNTFPIWIHKRLDSSI